jgi:hypothetical protein
MSEARRTPRSRVEHKTAEDVAKTKNNIGVSPSLSEEPASSVEPSSVSFLAETRMPDQEEQSPVVSPKKVCFSPIINRFRLFHTTEPASRLSPESYEADREQKYPVALAAVEAAINSAEPPAAPAVQDVELQFMKGKLATSLMSEMDQLTIYMQGKHEPARIRIAQSIFDETKRLLNNIETLQDNRELNKIYVALDGLHSSLGAKIMELKDLSKTGIPKGLRTILKRFDDSILHQLLHEIPKLQTELDLDDNAVKSSSSFSRS